MNFGIIALNRNVNTNPDYVTRILTVLLFILKRKIFTKTLLIMLKNGLTHLAMIKVIKDRFQWVNAKK